MRYLIPLLFLAGCGQSAKVRCSDLFIQILGAQQWEERNNALDQEVRDSAEAVGDAAGRAGRATLGDPDSVAAQMLRMRERILRRRATQMADTVIPPRPSEMAWYNEHCYNSQAR